MPENDLTTYQIAEHLEAQQEPMKAALIELVRIPSVCDEGAGGYPFGESIDRALRTALEIASDLGFKTTYGDGGYYGFAEIGEGEEMLGILGHLDVVPPGNLKEWVHDPFDPIEQNGMLFGRGTQDDKGPTVAALFAVKALMDAGVKFNKRVRLIFGTDEETLWRCINRYREKEELPGFGFSPDSRFPLIYAEKGVLQLHLECNNESGMRFSGGSAFNAVPDQIYYDGDRLDDLASKLDELGYAYNRSSKCIEVLGKAAHAMDTEDGVNAIARLCIALDAMGLHSNAVRFMADVVAEDPYATPIFGECADEPSGRLKLNVGKIELSEVERLSIDCRLPVTVSKEEVVSKLIAVAAGYGLFYKEFDWLTPIYLPLDHYIIKSLMKVYQEISGDLVTKPRASGGATYARAMENCVAFGALLPGEPITEHQSNERAVVANLYKAMEIYAHAAYELTR